MNALWIVRERLLKGERFHFEANDVAAAFAELHANEMDGFIAAVVLVGVATILDLLQRLAFGL